jgi:hypothetical protein
VEKKSGSAIFPSDEPRGMTTTPPSRPPRAAPRSHRGSLSPPSHLALPIDPARPPLHLRGPVPSQTLTAVAALRPHAAVVVRTPSTTPLPPTSHAVSTSPDPLDSVRHWPSSVSFHRERCPSEQAVSSGGGPLPERANVKSGAAGQNLVSSFRPYRW